MKLKSLLFLLTLTLSSTAAQAFQSFGTCYAYTTCFNRFGIPAGAISCHVSGNASAGVACNWFVTLNRSVSCSGFAVDQFGRYGWVNFYDTCARFW